MKITKKHVGLRVRMVCRSDGFGFQQVGVVAAADRWSFSFMQDLASWTQPLTLGLWRIVEVLPR